MVRFHVSQRRRLWTKYPSPRGSQLPSGCVKIRCTHDKVILVCPKDPPCTRKEVPKKGNHIAEHQVHDIVWSHFQAELFQVLQVRVQGILCRVLRAQEGVPFETAVPIDLFDRASHACSSARVFYGAGVRRQTRWRSSCLISPNVE